jgi:hypothetical protein
MGERLFTDKLIYRLLGVAGSWSLDSATPAIITYPAHASGSPSFDIANETVPEPFLPRLRNASSAF